MPTTSPPNRRTSASFDDLVAEQFQKARQLFEERVQSSRLMCRIYDTFVGPDDKNHNCLGCNFDDLTEHVARYLAVCANQPAAFLPHQAFALYVLLLNALWERMDDVFHIVGVHESYIARHFSPFIRARRWANFFKHPKEFGWMVHHPQYTVEGSEHSVPYIDAKAAYVLVNDDFLKKFYACDTAKGLAAKFKGAETKVAVLLPDIEQLTGEVCACLTRFVDIITQSPVYVEILNDKSTIAGYYTRLCDTTGARELGMTPTAENT